MSEVVEMKYMGLSALKAESADRATKDGIINSFGEALDGIEVMGNQVLVGIYIPPAMTKGGIIRPHENRDESKHQGKAFLVLKKGPLAFVDGGNTSFRGQTVEEGDWVVGRISDGWPLRLNGVECRIYDDIHIKLKVQDPDKVY